MGSSWQEAWSHGVALPGRCLGVVANALAVAELGPVLLGFAAAIANALAPVPGPVPVLVEVASAAGLGLKVAGADGLSLEVAGLGPGLLEVAEVIAGVLALLASPVPGLGEVLVFDSDGVLDQQPSEWGGRLLVGLVLQVVEPILAVVGHCLQQGAPVLDCLRPARLDDVLNLVWVS